MRITTAANGTAATVSAQHIETVAFSPDQLRWLAALLEPHTRAEPLHVASIARRLQRLLRSLDAGTDAVILFSE